MEHGWGLLIGSRELSRIVFCFLFIETGIHFGGFFLFAMEAQHMGSAYYVWIKQLLLGGMFFF